MKNILAIIVITIVTTINAQSKKTFQSKWIKNENYTMLFYAVNDTTKVEMGKIKNSIELTPSDYIKQSMIFSSPMFKSDFKDNSLYTRKTLTPILHISSNDKRSIQIIYKGSIKCSYIDMQNGKKQAHTEMNNSKLLYYDSSTYQNIIRWLPLKEGYKEELDVYNYDPNTTIGFMKVKITDVSHDNYKTQKSGIREVFRVTEFFGESKTVHFIDKVDRRLWKVEVNDGKVIMLRQE
tara:strand:+ start:6905 stop:7612 length:708 start_codon:yes stop_codon:yes gene_type:complete